MTSGPYWLDQVYDVMSGVSGLLFPVEPDSDVDASPAFAALLQRSASLRVPIIFRAGVYTFSIAPGVVIDPDVQDCPRVTYDYIDLRAPGGTVTFNAPVGPTDASAQPISRAILNAHSATGGIFRMIGDFVIDGGITTTPTFFTGADPQAQCPLEVVGYDRVIVGPITVKNCYGNWDDRANPASAGYDPAAEGICSYRRGGMLFDANEYFEVNGLIVGESWREGPFITNGNVVRIINNFEYHGPASYATRRISSPLNPFGQVAVRTGIHTGEIYGSEARDVLTRITVASVTGAWGGSFMNVGWVGDCYVDAQCEIAGKVPTTGVDSVALSADVWGPGWDFGAEVNPVASKSLTVNNLRMKNNHRYSVLFTRTQGTNDIANLYGSVVIDGGWWGPRVSGVANMALTVNVDNVVQYFIDSLSYGIGITMEDCGSGTLSIYGSGQLTVPGSTGDPATRTSTYGIIKNNCDGVVVSGSITDFATALYSGDYAVDHVASTGVHLFGQMAFVGDDYPASPVQIARDASRRVNTVNALQLTYNGASPWLTTNVAIFADYLPGVNIITLSPGGDQLVSAPLGIIQAVSTDGSSPGPGVKGQIFAMSDANGRGGVWHSSTRDHVAGDVLYNRPFINSPARNMGTTRYLAPRGYSMGAATITVTADLLYGIPCDLDYVFSALGISVTAAGAGGSAVRLGIYGSDLYGYPTDLLLDVTGGSPLATDAIAALVAALAGPYRIGGPLWLAALFSDTPTVEAFTGNTALHNIFGASSVSSTGIPQAWTVAQAYGALPPVFPDGGAFITTAAPAIGIRS